MKKELTDVLCEDFGVQAPLTNQRLDYFKLSGRINSVDDSVVQALEKHLSFFVDLNIYVSIKLSDTIETVYFSTDNIKSINNLFQNFVDLVESHDIEFELETTDWGNNVFIFSQSALVNYFRSLTLYEVLIELSKKAEIGYILFNFFNDYNSKSSFIFRFGVAKYADHDHREEVISKRDRVAHFVNAEQFRYIPDDFNVTTPSLELNTFFDRLRAVFLLIFLSDFSRIVDDQLIFKIKGYKTFNCRCDGIVSEHVLRELELLYKWAYDEGAFTDKVGIVRNVMTIHVTNEDINSLEVGTCDSAKSGYDLYLKDNVKQYIDIKNKIGDMLHSQSEKASTITKDMFKIFKTSIWTFVTFFTTSIILRSLRLGDISFESLDNKLFLVGVFFLFISTIYIFFARSEVESEKKRLSDKFLEIRDRYKDLLNEADLDKILAHSNGKSISQNEIDYIDDKKKKYTILWWIINISMFILWCFLFKEILSPMIFDNTDHTVNLWEEVRSFFWGGDVFTALLKNMHF